MAEANTQTLPDFSRKGDVLEQHLVVEECDGNEFPSTVIRCLSYSEATELSFLVPVIHRRLCCLPSMSPSVTSLVG